MANKNFIVKNGLEVGGQEVVSSSGVVTSAALGGQTLASTDSPTFNNLTLTNDIAVGGDLNLTGDLNITGDVNSVSVTDLDVTDQTITLGAGQVESASGGSGIVVDGSNASILWDETNDEWDFNKSINVTGAATISTDLNVGGAVKGNAGIRAISVGAAGSASGGIQLWAATNQPHFVQFGDEAGASANHYRGFLGYNHATDSMQIGTASTERLRIDSSGNTFINGCVNRTTTQGNANFQILTTNGQGANLGGSVGLGGVYHATNQITFAEIHGKKENSTTANLKGYMSFVTRDPSGGSEKMRIDSSGNVGINATPKAYHSDYKAIDINNSASVMGYTGNNGAWLMENLYIGTDNNWKHKNSDFSALVEMYDGVFNFYNTASGTAGATATLQNRLKIKADGDVAFAASATGAALIKCVSGDQTDRDAGGYPQYTFAGNEGTGMRRAGANILAFDAGGSENMRINQTGGLSIDTTNVPANTTGALVLANGGAGGPSTTQPGGGLWIEDAAGTPKLTLYRASGDALRIDAQGDNDLIFDNTGSHGFAFVKGGTTLFGIDESASGIVKTTLPVGIGVTSILSGYKLEVGGSIVIPSASFLANRSSAGSNWGLIRGNDSGTTIIGDSQSLQIAVGGNVTAGGSPYDTEGNLICYGSGQNSLIIQTPDNTLDRGIAWRNSGGAYIANIYVTDAGSNIGDMVFGVSNATQTDVTNVEERMRIDSSGNVGIGAAPTAFNNYNNLDVRSKNTSGGAVIGIHDTDGTRVGCISHSEGNPAFDIEAFNSNPMRFFTGSEAMRILADGGICMNVPGRNNGAPEVLNIYGSGASGGYGINIKCIGSGGGTMLRFNTAGNIVGQITTSSNATTYHTSSDARLKDITGKARGLEVINALNPVAYNWKLDGSADEGLIAQEVESIVPNATHVSKADDDSNGMYSMDYSKLVVHLIAGMKEQQTIIEDLKTRLDEAGL